MRGCQFFVLNLFIVAIASQTVLALSGSNTRFHSIWKPEGTQLQTFFGSIPISTLQQMTGNPQSSSEWSVLTQNSVGGSAKWVTPSPVTQNLQSVSYSVTYSFTFSTECPKNTVILRISATNIYRIGINGKQINEFLGRPWSTIQTITFPKNNFKCGQNNMSITVHNYRTESPLGVIYRLTQDTEGCSECYQEWENSFYNKSSCQCQCSKTENCDYSLKQWLTYPFCRCECAQPPCPRGYIKDPSTCQCVSQCPQNPTCDTNQLWSTALCRCVSKCGDIPHTQCNYPQRWDPINCQCSCTPTTCSASQVLDRNTCQCRCSEPEHKCQIGKRWSNENCGCECLQQTCKNGYYQDRNTCQCKFLSIVTLPGGLIDLNADQP